ncbi:NUDIX domain-containing protein [Streptomyces sp. NPDC058268]|uniref:NUDIX hydrolase n=1 Tax=Streptomyces sp. NPDC058268 TaxID=3346413 RepID=UPI0036F0A75A
MSVTHSAAEIAAFLATHPAPVMAVDALIRDAEGRILLVDPVYKDGWDLPGGMVDDEEPMTALARELREELQIPQVRIGRLLAVDSLGRETYGRCLVAHIYAVHLPDAVPAKDLVLQDDEIRAAEFVPEAQALERLPELLRHRLTAALAAERGAHTAHLREGIPVPVEPRDHYAMLPAPMVSATALITDGQGRVLVVEMSYHHGDGNRYGLPGGMVEANESPQQGAAREIAQELGLAGVPIGRLLAIDSAPASIYGRALDLHVFAVGPLTDDQIAHLHFPDGEIVATHWLAPAEAIARLPERVGHRVRHGLQALATGTVAHLERGIPQPGSGAGIPAARRAELERTGQLSRADHRAVRPKAYTGVTVLFTDTAGRVLVVEPTYRDDGRWLLPGGAIDSDTGETPRRAAQREVREELGLNMPLGALLATDWGSGRGGLAEVNHVFDGGVLDEQTLAHLRLPERELSQWRLVEPDDLHELLLDRLVPRVQACLAVRAAGGGAIELTEGRPAGEGAVAIVYHPETGELLLHERDEHAPCWPEYWSLLGGGVDPGEFADEAVRRELAEEARLHTGQSPQFVERVWDRDGSGQLISVYAVPYTGTVEELTLGEGRQLRFVAPGELGGYVMPPYLRAVVDRWLTHQPPSRTGALQGARTGGSDTDQAGRRS